MRARMALCYSQIVFELREISLRDKPASMLAISPKGTVPVLQLPDGHVIDESLDIMLWALAQNDPAGWCNENDRAQMLDLIHQNDTEFKSALDRYKYPSRYVDVDVAYERDRAMIFFAVLAARLPAHRFLFSDNLSLADVAIFPFVRQFARHEGERFAEIVDPRLQKWLSALMHMPLFFRIMEKYPLWQSGQSPTVMSAHVD